MLTNELKPGELYSFPKWFAKIHDYGFSCGAKVYMNHVVGKPLMFLRAKNFKYEFLWEGKNLILRPNQIRHLQVLNLKEKTKTKQNKKTSRKLEDIIGDFLKKRHRKY
jgi:hypothetical protein